MDLLSDQIAAIERQEPGVIPDLRDGRGLCVGSDYSGDHGTPKYETYSFIVTCDAAVPEWDRLCKAWRQARVTILGDKGPREMSYKKVTEDNIRAQALGEFLKVANSLRGLVLTVAVDQTINWMSPDRLLENDATWKPDVFDRVMRYSHFISLLVAGLSKENQALGWMTDRDKIAANKKQKHRLPLVFGQVLAGLYLGHKLGPVSIGDNEGADISFSDFLAIPDLIAGAFCEVLEHHQGKMRAAGSTVRETFSMKDVAPKAKEIIDWHIESHHPLKRLFLIIDPNLDGGEEPFNIIWPDLRRLRQSQRVPTLPVKLMAGGRSVFKAKRAPRRRLYRKES